ncbi:hypothetical protein BGW80DRAFT_1379362 [Lactifluus volemus]|nr:hypothetical protein BGW80DRAFT_1379362 [Lactifluus volemus]
MSEEKPRWVERNVDGLVQLLQSDKPMEDEVKVTLVVAFLAEEARRPLLTKLQGQGDSCVE